MSFGAGLGPSFFWGGRLLKKASSPKEAASSESLRIPAGALRGKQAFRELEYKKREPFAAPAPHSFAA